ncbi:unnamed protein product, partial [Brugia timori]
MKFHSPYFECLKILIPSFSTLNSLFVVSNSKLRITQNYGLENLFINSKLILLFPGCCLPGIPGPDGLPGKNGIPGRPG